MINGNISLFIGVVLLEISTKFVKQKITFKATNEDKTKIVQNFFPNLKHQETNNENHEFIRKYIRRITVN